MAYVDPRSLALNRKYGLGQFAPQPPSTHYGPEGPNPYGVAGGSPPGAVAPGAPPNFAALLAQLAASAPNRSDADWNTLLDARTRPFTDAISQSTDMARAMNEYRLETKSAANQGLGGAFLSILTGGKTGAEAEAFSKANFGGSYLGAQAMSMAADKLYELTADFDEGDWKISGQYLEAMQQIPGIREDLRKQIEGSELDAYERKFKTATLLMDETWRHWQENRKNFESDRSFKREKGESARDFAERKRQFNEQMALARGELGANIVDDAADNATAAKNAGLREAEFALKVAREQRGAAKDKASIRQADARIAQAKANLAWQKEKDKLARQGGGSDAQKAERGLALDVLQDRDTILGKPKASGLGAGKRVGGMEYDEAYEYVYGLIDAQVGMRRTEAYKNAWVKARLRALGLIKQPVKSRGG